MKKNSYCHSERVLESYVLNFKYGLVLVFLSVFVFSCQEKEQENIKLSGPVFGTAYNIQYTSTVNYQKQIDSLFAVVNQSLSTYSTESDISKWNRNETIEVDTHFEIVFNASKKIFKETKGVFDPTIGNVVNAWNFGPDKNKFLTDSTTIANLMQSVGFDRVIMINTSKFIKPNDVYLDFNAIAKGYGVDVIGQFLEQKGVANYLIEIGGEIRVKGLNIEKGKAFTVGLDLPRFDGGQSVMKALALSNQSMATSGTYRKFKTDAEGNRYAHIINTKTGYPTKTNVLSVSVIAPNCMLADGYATAFQAMGLEATELFLKTHPELKVFFIYESDTKEMNTKAINGFPE